MDSTVDSTRAPGPKPDQRRQLLPLPFGQWPAEARLLLGMVALWSLVGLLVLASASWWVASREMGDAAYYLKRQAIWLVASWGLLWLGIRINLRRWLRLAAPALLITGLMVAATLVAGSTVNGSSRWLLRPPWARWWRSPMKRRRGRWPSGFVRRWPTRPAWPKAIRSASR